MTTPKPYQPFINDPVLNSIHTRSRSGRALAAFIGILMTGTSAPLANAASEVTRSLSCGQYVPGIPITVTIQAAPDANALAWAVEETPPAGWTVTNINEAGLWDGTNKKVKWGPFFDNNPRTLLYDVTPPTGTTATVTMTGIASFDGINITISGDSTLSLDTTEPTLTCPASPTPVVADADCLAVLPDLTTSAWAIDNCNYDVTITQNPPVGQQVGVGNILVTLTATDMAGNTDTCTVQVSVVDATVPVITCPAAPDPLLADESCQAMVPDFISQTSASDNCDDNVSIAQQPAAGSSIGVGDHTVAITATDDAGNTRACNLPVSVINHAPTIAEGPGPIDISVEVGSHCDQADNTVALNATDTNHDPSQLIWQVKSAPDHGTASFPNGNLGANATVCYEPESGYAGNDTFVIEVIDACGDTDELSINATVIACNHPADSDTDWQISIQEMTSYAACWRMGCTWPQEPNPIPIGHMTRSAYLWKNGELYHYDPAYGEPGCWLPGATATLAIAFNLPATSILEEIAPSDTDRTMYLPMTQTQDQSSLHIAETPAYPMSTTSTATRSFDQPCYPPQQPIVVSIAVAPDAEAIAWATEDQVPATWIVTSISDEGVFDHVNGKVKWGPFFDRQARSLTYTTVPPPTATGQVTFKGIASFNGADVDTNGSTTMPEVIPFQIITNPSPMQQIANVGDDVAYAVTCSTSPAYCQWYKDGTSIPDATAPTIKLNNVSITDVGSYWCVASDACGNEATSRTVTLNIARATDTGQNIPSNEDPTGSQTTTQKVGGFCGTGTIAVLPLTMVGLYGLRRRTTYTKAGRIHRYR